MEGHIRHARTQKMMEIALMHARAQLSSFCSRQAPAACQAYEGSVWNAGAHLTVIVDRCACPEHASRLPFTDVEVWVYDVSGDAPIYLGKEGEPSTKDLPMVPGDIKTPTSRPFLKN